MNPLSSFGFQTGHDMINMFKQPSTGMTQILTFYHSRGLIHNPIYYNCHPDDGFAGEIHGPEVTAGQAQPCDVQIFKGPVYGLRYTVVSIINIFYRPGCAAPLDEWHGVHIFPGTEGQRSTDPHRITP